MKFWPRFIFPPCQTFQEFDKEMDTEAVKAFSTLKQIKIRDITARDLLYQEIEKNGLKCVKEKLAELKTENGEGVPEYDAYRWKTVFRKFVETINPIIVKNEILLLDVKPVKIEEPEYRSLSYSMENDLVANNSNP